MTVARITDIIRVMEGFAPMVLAENWDNVGLQIGQHDWLVKTVRVALNPSNDVVAQACKDNTDVLITHHPLIFKPMERIDFSTPVGSVIQMATLHKMALFVAHTNLDIVAGGLNDVLAEKIGIKNLVCLKGVNEQIVNDNQDSKLGQGIGRVGELGQAEKLTSLAQVIKKKLGIKSVKIAGKPELDVKKVAICTGSGSSLMECFLSSGAQVFISGDLRYHDALAAKDAGLGLIDIGHFNSEHLIVDVLAGKLQEALSDAMLNVNVGAYDFEKDPFVDI
jgi:dinuclear metal center YbgI/SA1388 family protein